MPRADEFYGSHDVSRMFPGNAPQTTVPWPTAGPTKTHRVDNPKAIHEALSSPHPDVRTFDPRELHASQPGLQRAAVDYYLNDKTYRETGQTFADHHQDGNAKPVVFHDLASDKKILRSGHHRAASDLLAGRQFEGVYVAGIPATHADGAAFQREQIQAQRSARMAARGLSA